MRPSQDVPIRLPYTGWSWLICLQCHVLYPVLRSETDTFPYMSNCGGRIGMPHEGCAVPLVESDAAFVEAVFNLGGREAVDALWDTLEENHRLLIRGPYYDWPDKCFGGPKKG